MSTLILVEHDNQALHPVNRSVLAAALQLDPKPVLLVAGHECEAVAKEAATVPGASSVLYVDDACFQHGLAENTGKLLAELGASFTTIIAPATTFGKNTLPRAAALMDMAQVTDVTKMIDENTFEHPIYAGNAIETVRVLTEKKALSIRITAFDPVQGVQEACCIERVQQSYSQKNSQFVRHELSESIRPELGSAEMVVSGGRGLQSAEKFKLIEALADVLGAAVGASRAAVDAGFVPNDYQVGQTGRVVAPSLYIAVGISGAIQHLAGMKDSKVIVAINKDADAPIFQIADYGLVGDLFELVPALIKQLKEHI